MAYKSRNRLSAA